MPPKGAKRVLFGEKKRHTIKTQVIIKGRNKEIVDVRQAKGREHDFTLYKDTIGKDVDTSIIIQTDLGYLGIEKLHANSQVPYKESKKHKLTKGEKAYNRRLLRQRVVIEHINAKIKTFKIMAYPYRNHCKKHLLRMTLICAIINLENPCL
jgi:hypothetical protein